jgi:hypothetical protein
MHYIINNYLLKVEYYYTDKSLPLGGEPAPQSGGFRERHSYSPSVATITALIV